MPWVIWVATTAGPMYDTNGKTGIRTVCQFGSRGAAAAEIRRFSNDKGYSPRRISEGQINVIERVLNSRRKPERKRLKGS